jgi:predicted acetyltransferase
VIDIRTITADEVIGFQRAVCNAFGFDYEEKGDDVERFEAVTSLDTTFVAVESDRIVATFGSFPFDLTVPGGGTVPMAGTTMVSVAPTHRRRGILTEIMGRHLTQVADELEVPVAGLWASDERIYRRFGYGPASWVGGFTIPTEEVTVPVGPPGITFRAIDADEAATALPPVYDAYRPTRPGALSRSAAWWFDRHLEDPKHRRSGGSAQRIVVAERDGRLVGYVLYRQREVRSGSGDHEVGMIDVRELIGVDEDARRALWSFAARIDLFPLLRYRLAPVDDPLLVEVERPRGIEQAPFDALWLRPLDVPRLLEARTYRGDGQVVLDVDDPTQGRGGRFRLEVADGKGHCAIAGPGTGPVLSCTIADLGSLYLGGRTAGALARAGRVTGPPETVALVDQLLASPVAPHCPEIF